MSIRNVSRGARARSNQQTPPAPDPGYPSLYGPTVTDGGYPALYGPSQPPSPLVGKSGLPWNSLVFGHGTTPAAFETWRNRPVDGVLYFPARQTWADMKALPSRRAGDLVVYSVPPFPEGIGGSNAAVVAGTYDTQIQDWAQHLVNSGWNTSLTVIRLGWESNGTWYQWSWDKGGVQTFVDAYRRFVQQARAQGLTNVKWNWCLNKGPQAAYSSFSWTTAYPGDDVVDVIGIDSYDHWTPSFNETQWTANTTGKNPGLDDIATFCRAQGKLMSLDEWGVTHPADADHGGDNAWYLIRTWQWLVANADVLAWENTYDHDGAPSSLNHKLSDGGNPNAAAAYLSTSRWGA